MGLKLFTGKTLVEIIPSETTTPSGVQLPTKGLSPEQVQEEHANPRKPQGLIGIVKGIGPWPKIKSGLLLMPEFSVGSRVVVSQHRGSWIKWKGKTELKLVDLDDVLAIVIPPEQEP